MYLLPEFDLVCAGAGHFSMDGVAGFWLFVPLFAGLGSDGAKHLAGMSRYVLSCVIAPLGRLGALVAETCPLRPLHNLRVWQVRWSSEPRMCSQVSSQPYICIHACFTCGWSGLKTEFHPQNKIWYYCIITKAILRSFIWKNSEVNPTIRQKVITIVGNPDHFFVSFFISFYGNFQWKTFSSKFNFEDRFAPLLTISGWLVPKKTLIAFFSKKWNDLKSCIQPWSATDSLPAAWEYTLN